MISKTRSFRDLWNPIGVLIFWRRSRGGRRLLHRGIPRRVRHEHEPCPPVRQFRRRVVGHPFRRDACEHRDAGLPRQQREQRLHAVPRSDLSGGISNVSCFGNTAGCHHGPVSGWVAIPPASQNHGVSAKKAPGNSGFVSCKICHGSNFAGTTSAPSCLNMPRATDRGSFRRTRASRGAPAPEVSLTM